VVKVKSRLSVSAQISAFSARIISNFETRHFIIAVMVLLAVVSGLLALLAIRLSICLPGYKRNGRRKVTGSSLKTMVIFGSGKDSKDT